MGLAERTPPTAEEYARWRQRFCNWGRWGADDELGTLNFVTAEVRAAAAAWSVRARRQPGPPDRHRSPVRPTRTRPTTSSPCEESGGMLDYIGLFIHGFTQTHIDALCHLQSPTAASGTANRWAQSHARRAQRHHRLLAGGIVTRGVLYDVPRLRGTDYVEPGHPVHGLGTGRRRRRPGGRAPPRRRRRHPQRARPLLRVHPGERPGFGSPAGVHAGAWSSCYDTELRCWCGTCRTRPPIDQGIPNPRRLPRHCTSTRSCCPTWACRSRQRRPRGPGGGLRRSRALGIPVRRPPRW